ncbi:MAG TPA: hypothetical protein PK583_03210 [Gammaproteobacteria bacterium]|nr:hypothetical protein [Gammaproteobacteria bacterium]
MPTAKTIMTRCLALEYTLAMESALDGIAEGKQEYLAVVAAADQELQLSLRNL